MINKLKPKSEFTKNVLTLMTGTTIAQAIPILASPILTRIYTPEDFGVLSLFLAFITIFGSIASGRYELSIVLPEEKREAVSLVALSFIIVTATTLSLLLIVIFFHNNIISILNNKQIGIWLYFVPLAVFFIGIFNILNFYNTREKKYKDIAKSKVIKSSVLAIVPIVLGYIKSGAMGLISGQILSQMFANYKLLKNLLKDKDLLFTQTYKEIIEQAKKYINFPKFSMLGVLANILSIQLTNILISTFFSVATLGFYSLVQKILGLPSALIGGSIGQVYFEQASKEKNNSGNTLKIFKQTVKKSFIIGFIIFFPLYFILEDLFAFVFGEEWRIAGVYAKIVLPFFYIRFVAVTVSTTFSIFNFLKTELSLKVLLLIGMVSIVMFNKNKLFNETLYYISFYGVLIYLISLILSYKISKGTKL